MMRHFPYLSNCWFDFPQHAYDLLVNDFISAEISRLYELNIINGFLSPK